MEAPASILRRFPDETMFTCGPSPKIIHVGVVALPGAERITELLSYDVPPDEPPNVTSLVHIEPVPVTRSVLFDDVSPMYDVAHW